MAALFFCSPIPAPPRVCRPPRFFVRKSHGIALAHPVAPLMWKSGTGLHRRLCRQQSSLWGPSCYAGGRSHDDVIALAKRGGQVWASRLDERRGFAALVAFRLFECSLHSSVNDGFLSFAHFIRSAPSAHLAVTRRLLRGSEKVAPHRMIRAISQAVRRCVKVPVMARSIGGVGVTRPIVSGHVG